MPNIKLNFGGLFGALVGGAGAFGLVYLAQANARLATRATIWGVIGGAILGNFLWSKLFPAPTPPDVELPS